MAPDIRTPSRFLWSVLRRRPWLLAAAALSGAVWMLPTALLPLVIGYTIDTGIEGDRPGALLRGVLLVLALAVIQTGSAAGLAWTAHTLWQHGTGTTQRIAVRHITRLGLTLPRRVRTGEAVAIGSSDVYQVGTLFEVLGRAAGSVVSFLVAAVIVVTVSPTLGLVVLIGVPLATVGIGPMLPRLSKREDEQREQLSMVNGVAADVVSGLRILRGAGGEARFRARFAEASQRARTAGIAVGRIVSWLAGAEVLLPGLVTVLVTWLGARLAVTGTIGIGELVAFYGVSAFLVIPVRTATEALGELSAALVAARRVCDLLRLRREPEPPERPVPLPPGALSLFDETSGLDIPGGKLTVIDARGTAEEFAERLARHAEPRPPARVLAGAVALSEVDPDVVRGRIVLLHNQDLLFSGPVRAELDLGTAVDLDNALNVADAHDILEALPEDAELDERGRSLSGGQRQRLILARALCADADVLVLDEPTSAVDAHTEARIVERIKRLRAGRTTVVLSQSPLWMKVADHVLETP